MHTDENKRFDKRNIERNIKGGIITQKDYEIYLSRLPDASDKAVSPEASPAELEDFGSKKEDGKQTKKRAGKKKAKRRGK